MRTRICHAIVMEIIGSSKEKSMVYVAVLTLAVIGFALVFSTWQILQRQEKASLEHLELTSLAVLQAVDSSLRRGPMMGGSRFSLETREFFRDIENNGDILFVGIVDEEGNRLAVEGDTLQTVDFPPGALETLRTRSRWQGVARYKGTQIYVAARRIQGTGGMHRPGERGHHREGRTPLLWSAANVFLVVAMDMEKNFAVYQGVKRTAIFQTAYILAAAVSLWFLAVRFISRRKLAGKAAQLEQFQARLIDNLPDGLLITDGTGAILAANPAAQNILAAGNPAVGESLAGKTLAAVFAGMVPPVGLASDRGWQQRSMAGKQLEIRVLTLHHTYTALHGEEGEPSRMVIVRDRTHIRTLEQNLAEAEKLAAIGSLAAGVAHEIRNPLSALRGFAQYFAKKLAGKQPEEEYAHTMVRESDRLNRVITDLLYLAKPRNLAPVPTDMTAVCAEMRALLHFELQEQGVSLVCDLKTTTVNADPDALKQALLNLLLNALEAVEGSPDAAQTVAITTQQATEGGVAGVWVRVTDSGPGMREEEQAQACKPFFTTKKEGTGLGLALVHTIMQGHGGKVAITSPAAPDGMTGCAVGLFFPDATTTSGL